MGKKYDDEIDRDESVFIEILFQAHDLAKQCQYDRHEIEDELEEALESKEIGCISGAGAGLGYVNIDVEIESRRKLKKTIALIRRVLQKLKVPQSTVLHICGDAEEHIPVYA